MSPVLVVLAAGASRRLGECKALAELDGRSVLERLLEAGLGLRALGGPLGEPPDTPALVVAGAHAAEIGEHLAHLGGRRRNAAAGAVSGALSGAFSTAFSTGEVDAFPAELALNADWRAGRLGSVATAVRARPGADLCLAPVDVPLVTRSTFEALARAWEAAGAPARGWLAPRFVEPDDREGLGEPRGAPSFGHPVVLGRALLEELSREPPRFAADESLRALRDDADPLWSVPVQDRGVLDDLDTPEDLATLRERIARR